MRGQRLENQEEPEETPRVRDSGSADLAGFYANIGLSRSRAEGLAKVKCPWKRELRGACLRFGQGESLVGGQLWGQILPCETSSERLWFQ